MTKAEQIKSYLAVKEVHSMEQEEQEEETEKSFMKTGTWAFLWYLYFVFR